MSEETISARPGGLERLVLRHAQRAPGRRFLGSVHGPTSVSFGQLVQRLRRCRSELDQAAIASGARVLIEVTEPLDFAVAFIGVVAAGRCAVPVDRRASRAELGALLAAARPEATMRDCPERVGAPALDVLPVPSGPFPDPAGAPARGSVLLLGSDAASAPAAIELTEDRLLHVAAAAARHTRLTALDRGFSPLPLSNLSAAVIALLATLVAGGELVLDGRFHRHGFWETLAAHDVTWVNLAPAMLTILADGPPPARVSRLRFIRSGDAQVPVAVRRRIEAMTGCPIVESYGIAEAGSQISATPLDRTAPEGSCGRPLATEVVVRGRDGQPVPHDTVGRVWIRGAGVMAADDGGRFDADGWLDTRDRGFLDADGYLFVEGSDAYGRMADRRALVPPVAARAAGHALVA